jgi:hypothetical protein
MLPWSKDRDDTEKLTVGSMAKFTLASNAAHDAELLAMLRREVPRQPEDVQPILKEVVEAVDTMEITHLRKAALAAIDDLKRKGPARSAISPRGARSVRARSRWAASQQRRLDRSSWASLAW